MLEKWAIPGGLLLVGVFFLIAGGLILRSCWQAWKTGAIRVTSRRQGARTVWHDRNPNEFWFHLVCDFALGVAVLSGTVPMVQMARFLSP